MQAMLISDENLQEIREVLVDKKDPGNHMITLESYAASRARWFILRGYTDPKGYYHDIAILPEYVLRENFEFNAAKAETDWDTIVRL